jgi:hypothetical protein
MGEVCETEFVKFRIKLDKENIKVGGRNFCVNLALYQKETSLYWLKTADGGCELEEKDIRGNKTIQMTDLAFSLLRKYHPERNTFVTLLDDSGFSWKDKSGRTLKTNFLKGYLLFYGKTWYEDKFNAVMCNSELYRVYREKANTHFDDPSKKPESFDFLDTEAKEKLTPLYRDSKTWREFTNKIIEKYGEIKYSLIYHWYRSAIYIIFDGIEINQDWKIELSQRPNYSCRVMSQRGGKKTRKFSKFKRLEPFSWHP